MKNKQLDKTKGTYNIPILILKIYEVSVGPLLENVGNQFFTFYYILFSYEKGLKISKLKNLIPFFKTFLLKV